MINNNDVNNPFDALINVLNAVETNNCNVDINEIEGSIDIYDKCKEFFEKAVFEIIKQTNDSSIKSLSIKEIEQIINLTDIAKTELYILVDFNNLLKNEKPMMRERKQQYLEQKTNEIAELLKIEIRSLDHIVQDEMKKDIVNRSLTSHTYNNVCKLLSFKTLYNSIDETPLSRLTFFTFKSYALDETDTKSFNKLDELLPKAKERIKELPIIFQHEVFYLILSRPYSVTHLKFIEKLLHYFESVAILKDSSQLDLISKMFGSSLFPNIDDVTSLSVEIRQKVIDLFLVIKNTQEQRLLIQTLTNAEGEIHLITLQYLKHTDISTSINDVLSDLKMLRNSLPPDFKSELTQWKKLSALLKKDPQLARLLIANYQNNILLLDYFLTVEDKTRFDLNGFIQELKNMPADMSHHVKKHITNLSSEKFTLAISLWEKIGVGYSNGWITYEEYINTLKILIHLADAKYYLLKTLENLNGNEYQLLYNIFSKISLDEFSLKRIVIEFCRMNKEALFDEMSEKIQSYIDFNKLFLMDSYSVMEFVKILTIHLDLNIEKETVLNIYSKIDPLLWPMISRLASFDLQSRQKILAGNKEFSSIHFLDTMTKIYEKNPDIGDYFLEFHRKYPSHTGLLIDFIFKIGTISFAKLVNRKDLQLDEHIKLFLRYIELPNDKLQNLCDMYVLHPSLTALCLKIPPEKGIEIVKIIPDQLEWISTQMINEWINDPVFLSNTVEYLSNHSNDHVAALRDLTCFKNMKTTKTWVSLFQFDKDGIISSSQRRTFFELALVPLAHPALGVKPVLMFDALVKIEKAFPTDFSALLKNYHRKLANRVRNILDVVQMGEMSLAGLLCQNALIENRPPKDIKEQVISHLSDVLNSTSVQFYQQLMRLDPIKDEKLLLWIENITKKEQKLTEKITSLLMLNEQGKTQLVNYLLKELDQNNFTNTFHRTSPQIYQKNISETLENSVRRETLLKCINKGRTALASYIFAQKQAFWEVDPLEENLMNSLSVQESLWNIVGDSDLKEVPCFLKKYLRTILSSKISRKDCVIALGYLQHILRQDPLKLKKLPVFKSVDDLKDFIISCDTTDPKKIFMKAMPSKDEMKHLSLIEQEKLIEYRSTVALAQCIVTRRGSLNTALLPFYLDEICSLCDIPQTSSFAKHLHHVFNDMTQYREEYTQVLQKLIDPLVDKQLDSSELIVRLIKRKKSSVPLKKIDYVESVVSSILTRSRQGDNRGNCFAMQTMILTESDHQGLIRALEDDVDLLSKGKLIRHSTKDEYPLIIDQILINKGYGHPLQSSRAYTIAQMNAPLKVADALIPSLELLNSPGVIGQYIVSRISRIQNVQNSSDFQKGIQIHLNKILKSQVSVFYSLEFQIPGTNIIGAWLLKNRDTGEVIDCDDKYIELLKGCCQLAAQMSFPKPFLDAVKFVFKEVEKFIDSPHQRSAIINVPHPTDPTKTYPRWMGKLNGGKGMQIRKCYNDQPDFSMDCIKLDTSSEEAFLNNFDGLMDRLPLQKVEEMTANKYSKLPVETRLHDCNINIGTLLQKKMSSTESTVDRMNKEGYCLLQQFVDAQIINKIMSQISTFLELNNIQQEKFTKYVTLNNPDAEQLSVLTHRIEEWLTNYFSTQVTYNQNIPELNEIINNVLLEENLQVPEVLTLFDSNWIAEGYNNTEYGYAFNFLSKSLKNVCVEGSKQIPCTPTFFTDFVRVTDSFN